LFEILVDLEILTTNLISEPAAKYQAFTEVERLKRASAFLEWRDVNPDAFGPKGDTERAFIAREGVRIRALAEKYWGLDKNKRPIFPRHWSGFDMRDRSQRLDKHLKGQKYSADYFYLYYMTSWHMHAGFAGHGGVPEAGLWNFMSYYHMCTQRIFLDGVLIVARALKLEIVLQGYEIGKFRREIEERRSEIERKLSTFAKTLPSPLQRP
jgi:hypothetical protein